MRKLAAALAVLASTAPTHAPADEPKPAQVKSFTTISPIFSELVVFSLPANFATSFEQPTPTQYIREAVLKGQTVDDWSQMITVTGAKGLAKNPKSSAQQFAAGTAAGFQHACPDTFAVKPLGPATISGHEAFIAVASCGKVGDSQAAHSETAAIVAIKGTEDVYTLQWAERTPASAENLTIDEAVWKARLGKLAPIRLCPIVAGEKAPYPSCLNRPE